MRFKLILWILAVCLGLTAPAFAYENFIPLGAGYASGKNVLPRLDSEEQAFTAQTDIFESELYRKQLEQRRSQSYLNRFNSDINSSASDNNIDY